jgi:excinuclease ABC subunit A
VLPWKVLGKKWHVSRKGFPSNKRIAWNAEVVERLLDILEVSLPGYEVDWSNKLRVVWTNAAGDAVVEVGTKRREGLLLSVFTSPGAIALGQISDLGAEREIAPHRNGREVVRVMFTTTDQVDAAAISRLVKRT